MMGSQWRDFKIGVIYAGFLIFVTRQAAVFWMRWRGAKVELGKPTYKPLQ